MKKRMVVCFKRSEVFIPSIKKQLEAAFLLSSNIF